MFGHELTVLAHHGRVGLSQLVVGRCFDLLAKLLFQLLELSLQTMVRYALVFQILTGLAETLLNVS